MHCKQISDEKLWLSYIGSLLKNRNLKFDNDGLCRARLFINEYGWLGLADKDVENPAFEKLSYPILGFSSFWERLHLDFTKDDDVTLYRYWCTCDEFEEVKRDLYQNVLKAFDTKECQDYLKSIEKNINEVKL
jgi:hypothetical protein